MSNKWHAMPISDVERTLKTHVDSGLSMHKARERLRREHREQGGRRKYLFAPSSSQLSKSVFSTILDPCMLLLLLCSLLAFVFGGSMQGALTLAIAVICCAVSVVMSYTSAKRLSSASDYSSPLVRVVRGGDKYYTDGRNVVKGDVILLSEGDLLPCDARIIDSSDLVVKELIHTAQGIKNRTVSKDYKLRYLKDDATVAPNATNMLYAGTAIVSGSAKAIVTSTGNDVYLASYLADGELARRNGKTGFERQLMPAVRVIRMISLLLAVLLSLVALVTSKNTQIVDNFLMLLACVVLASGDMLAACTGFVYSSYIYKLSLDGEGRSGRNGDLSATVKGSEVLDKLKDVTSLVIAGKAGITQGAFRISDVYTASGMLDGLTVQTEQGKRMLSLIYTYVKTLRNSNIEADAISGDIADALEQHVRSSGFDFAALDIYLRSLYYVNDGTRGYACAETASSQFRLTLTKDDSVIDYCTLIRRGEEQNDIEENDAIAARDFCREAIQRGATCLYVVSENEGVGTLEGVIMLEQPAIEGFEWLLSEFDKMGVGAYMFLDNETDDSIISDLGVEKLYFEKIARASELSADRVIEKYNSFKAFVGYSKQDYLAIIEKMKADGEKVAVISVDNSNNALISSATVGVSCDNIRFDSDKYKESAYSHLCESGKDTSARCSSQTRLFGDVVVRRSHSKGGGLSSVANAIKTAKTAHISLMCAVGVSARLMAAVLPFVIVSVIADVSFMSPFMMMAFAATARIASGAKESSTLSKLKSFAYCFVKAFFGSVSTLTSASSSSSCKDTTTGIRPTNSGMIPNLMRSCGCTPLSFSETEDLSSAKLPPKPILAFDVLLPMIFSKPTKAPPKIKRMLVVSICKHSC